LIRIDSVSIIPPQTVPFWTETIGIHIIEYDSVKKKTFHKEWSTEDDTCFDADHYKAELRKGLYKNGFAVRTGRLNRGHIKDTDEGLG
jgi:hypothetical protein